ncbi:HAMP domain-containing sensor histidine kinase [Paenibacillus sp. GYB003]|uniref:HAMP domain-containing sensor histidine kinase n=1 Tax=Paenibacillus sp. GYB003 TaxID=2994392 RepID=UPI002F960DF9
MNVIDFIAQSPNIDFAIASINGQMQLAYGNAKMKAIYQIEEEQPLPESSQLRKVAALAVKQKQDVAGVVIEENVRDRAYRLMAYCYRTEERGEERCQIALFDISGLCQFYEMQLTNEKRKLIGEMAAGTANSILNPLAVVRGSLQLIETTLKTNLASNHLADRLVAQSVDHYITLANHQVTEINNYVQRWLHLGKPFQLDLRPVWVSVFLESYIPGLQREAIKLGVPLVCEFPSADGQLLIDPHYLREVLDEFVKNSFDATNGTDGAVRLSVHMDEKTATVLIRDSGPGIAADMMKLVKDPFFTTKEDSIGLGLNFCEVVLQKMGGHYELSGDENGTLVRIVLPKMPAE